MRSPVSAVLLAALLGAGPLFAASTQAQSAAEAPADPRAGDPAYERAQRLFGEVRKVLEDAAQARGDAADEGGFGALVKRSVGLDAESRADRLLASAFEMIADAPITRMQEDIAERRADIGDLKTALAQLREERLAAPEDAGITGALGLAQDREAIDADIDEAIARIAANERAIEETKADFRRAMAEAGAQITPEQADLLLDSVTGGDVVKIAAAYEAARGVSRQLLALMDASGEDLAIAKRYYGMHTALLALLVHAQSGFVDKVDDDYLPRLDAIVGDVEAAREETLRLLGEDNTPTQQEALEANLESQRLAMEAAGFYREHLKGQRAEILEAREGAMKELRIADNTLRTVDASFQLRAMMESATMSFEALQNLQSPGIERIFRNEQLRREFRELSEKLAPGS